MPEETTETPVLDLLAKMTADSIEATSLDAETLMLVRLAALIAVDAAPASYLMNLGVATELDVDEECRTGRARRSRADSRHRAGRVGGREDGPCARPRDRDRRERGRRRRSRRGLTEPGAGAGAAPHPRHHVSVFASSASIRSRRAAISSSFCEGSSGVPSRSTSSYLAFVLARRSRHERRRDQRGEDREEGDPPEHHEGGDDAAGDMLRRHVAVADGRDRLHRPPEARGRGSGTRCGRGST